MPRTAFLSGRRALLALGLIVGGFIAVMSGIVLLMNFLSSGFLLGPGGGLWVPIVLVVIGILYFLVGLMSFIGSKANPNPY